MYRQSILLIISLFIAVSAYAQTTVNISNSELLESQDYTWTKDNVYLLQDMVFYLYHQQH